MKCPTWKQLRKMVNSLPRSWSDSSEDLPLRNYIERWPKSQQLAIALALSVAHWSPEARKEYNDAGRSNKGRDSFYSRHIDCGLCNLYCDFEVGLCMPKCPLSSPNCTADGSLYRAVDNAETHGHGFHAAADALYNELVRLYTIEWEKL